MVVGDALTACHINRGGESHLGILRQLFGDVDFPTQELNLGLLCCRRILYQLSHQGSPTRMESDPIKREMM